jgi:hypothetical protein
MVSPFLNWKIIVRFSFALHDSADPLWTRTECQHFWAKWPDSPPTCVYRFEVGQGSQFSWWYRFAELQTIRGNWKMVWRVRRKQIQHRAFHFVEIVGAPQNISNWELNRNKRSFQMRKKKWKWSILRLNVSCLLPH